MPENVLPNILTGPQPDIDNPLPSVPNAALQVPVEVEEEKRYVLDIIHVAKKLDDISDHLGDLIEGINLLVKNMIMERTPIDHWENIGKTIEYTVDYGGKKYLYCTCMAAITLQSSTGSTIPITAGKWAQAFLPRGSKLTIPLGSDTVPNQVLFRQCDFFMG